VQSSSLRYPRLTFKAINIIAKLSFFIMKTYNESMIDALEEFKKQDYVNKLKAQTTSETIPSNDEDLLAFLYDQVMMHT
jgi:hypothetical protein